VATAEARSTAIVVDAFRHGSIRRIASAYAAFKVAEMGVWISITATAHHFGGLREASVVLLVQLAPATVAGGVVGALIQRAGARRVLSGGLMAQAAALCLTGVMFATGQPRWIAYLGAACAAVAVTTTRPSVAALLPELVGSPRTLAATNVTMGWIDGASTLVGPALAAVLLEVSGFGAPFIAFAALLAGGAAATIGLPGGEHSFADSRLEVRSVREGLTEVVRSRPSRTVLAVLAVQAFVAGTIDLLFVIVAVDLLDRSNADAGWLSSAYGAGALIGSAATFLLVGRRTLWPAVVMAGGVLCVGLALLGLSHGMGSAAVILVVCGIGSAALMTSARTLLQRVTELRLLGFTFSLAEALEMAMLMLGVVAVPLLAALLTTRWIGLGVAAVLGAAILSALRPLVRSEGEANVSIDRIEELHAIDLLGLLPAAALETLAREAEPLSVPTGERFITQGEIGDRYYAITEGRVSVCLDGEEVAVVEAGSGVGELALMFDTPRTADVVALTDVELLAVGREPFLLAVNGHAPTAEHADRVMDGYLR
jgi:MFS family permease